jgi:hypothetical protein
VEDWEDVIETGTLAQCRRLSNKFVDTQQEIETWVEALGHYDNNEFEDALRVFDNIAETSKILFNCGVIHATIGEHERAVCLREWGVYKIEAGADVN